MAPLRMSYYGTIMVDPPWTYDGQWDGTSGWESKRHGFLGAGSNYDTMSLEQLLALGIGQWAKPDAHLYLWATNAFLAEAHQLADAWGFAQKTVVTWAKGRVAGDAFVHHIGPGHYFRNSTEHVLFCVRGHRARRLTRQNVPTLFIAPRGGHSEKPETFYDLVEELSPGPYLDVFARREREGWDVIGNEVGERMLL